MGKRQNHILIKVVENQIRILPIALSPDVEQQPSQKLEFSKCIITSPHSLLAFYSFYSYADMSRSNHVNIVCTISNGKCCDVGFLWINNLFLKRLFFFLVFCIIFFWDVYIFSNESNYFLLLLWRNSAGNHSFTFFSDLHYLFKKL